VPVFCYITDRRAFAGDESVRRKRLLEKIAEAARCGVDYIQLREKDISGRELEELARQAVSAVRENARVDEAGKPSTLLLINSRNDVALISGADGVHLRSDDISPNDVRTIWSRAHNCSRTPVISVSWHSSAQSSAHSSTQVTQAEDDGADFALFAPVFEKKDAPAAPSAGLAALRDACRNKVPVLALGGVTLENARACLDAGAVGIAAIRLFQENEIAEVLLRLRR
jgi:thiamine-phosphate pyrophosphorylase